MSPVEQEAISVIVPAYNCEETLETTLESLSAQSHSGWEAMVVDDGSADGTAEVAERFARGDSRVRLHRQANKGVSGARNAGIELASSPWMFFLDADDTIAPDAFEQLLGATADDPGVDAVLAGCQRIDASGRKLRPQLPGHHSDHFELFARVCAIVIHSCLVRTDLVRRAGGFDESLVTCEDWDLWQRIARLGARFTTIAAEVAVYRMRPGTASHDGRRMLRDGLLVIDRGHGTDERLRGIEGDGIRVPPPQSRDQARTYFACYAAGLEMALGRDARWVIDELGDGVGGLDPAGVAETLCIALADGRVASPGDWMTFPPEIHGLCRDYLTALGERLGDHWLAFGAGEELERMALQEGEGTRPRRVGRWQLIDLDLRAGPVPDCEFGTGVELVHCRLKWGEEELGELELLAPDGLLPARVLADAVVADKAWEVLAAFLEDEVHPQLEIEVGGGSARVLRGDLVLFEDALDPERPERMAVHDATAWVLMLQELWERPEMASDDFYAEGAKVGAGGIRTVRGERPVEIELADPFPALRTFGAGEVEVAVEVAGVPLSVLPVRAQGGWVSAQRLRSEVLTRCGFELCRAVVREGILLAPEGADGSLGARLKLAAKSRGDELASLGAEATVIGRGDGADGTTASRWIAAPPEGRADRVRLAELDGEPVTGGGSGGGLLLSAPLVLDRARRCSGGLGDESLLRSLEFEQTFATGPDPWRLESAYEQDKYDLTLGMVPAGVERAIELGCAEGHFTARLAGAVAHLTAADLSFTALSRARKRCAESPNVSFIQLDAFEGGIGGPYDLVVCGELLYYAESETALDLALAGIAAGLEPGGHLLTVHANVVADEPTTAGFDWDVPFGAATIDRALRRSGVFELRADADADAYRLQLWRRRMPRRRLLPRRVPRRRRVEVAAPDGIPGFLPGGGPVSGEHGPDPQGARQLPILMYHRVAPSGSEATARWRLHPEAFEEQLSWMREQGYCSIGFEQWRVAADRRRPVPENSVMITFDDGYADFPEFAQPLLAKYDFQATVFVVTDLVGKANEWDRVLGEEIKLMDWDELARLREAGVEIGSHSSAHRPLVSLSAAELARDFCRSRSRFHEELGFPVRALCYPYGLHDAAVCSVAGSCGFRYAVTTNEWRASFGENLLALPRLEVRGGDDLDRFRAMLRG